MQHSAEQEQFNEIIKDSTKRLVRLKLLGNFFQQINLVSIYIRTELIHQTFNDRKELDINKLELFHLQYTDSLIELLQKIKKGKEQQVSLLSNEILLNQEYIDRIGRTEDTDNFELERKFYSAKVSQNLRYLYTQLAEQHHISSFDWSEMAAFTYRYRESYYRELDAAQEAQLRKIERQANVYERPYVIIERKLLGKLNIQQFKVRFLCGFKTPEHTYELFSIFQEEDLFVYCVEDKAFFMATEQQLNSINIAGNTRQNRLLSEELNERNMFLQSRIEQVKTELKTDQESLLKEYLQTISAVDFMEHLQSVDAQTNILRTMLNLNINNS